MELTREEAVRLFREHWKWMAETGSHEKATWIRKNGFEHISCHCFLCEYTKGWCKDCPIVWGNDDPMVKCLKTRSPYSLWRATETLGERKRLAKIISELPEKEVTP